MKTIGTNLKFFLQLAKVNAIITRRLDGYMGSRHGLGFTDFMILYSLQQSSHEKLRRVDLAEKLGLTASGVTRLLAPMEKIGLIKREATEHDARVSFVALAPGGKRLLADAIETADVASNDLVPKGKEKKIEDLYEVLTTFSLTQI